MKKLSFVGIGAPKSGTTWLSDQLSGHPQVFIPKAKEMQYFSCRDLVYDQAKNPRGQNFRSAIKKDFQPAQPGQLWGEFTTHYLYEKQALEKIRAYNPDIKILVMLRNPLDQIKSSYNYTYQSGRVSAPISQAIFQTKLFLNHVSYGLHLTTVYKIFQPSQIFVGYFDQITSNPKRLLNQVAKFLGIKPFPGTSLTQPSNQTISARNHHFNQLVAWTQRHVIHTPYLYELVSRYHLDTNLARLLSPLMYSNTTPPKPQLTKKALNRLAPLINQDLTTLEKLVKKNLTHWRIKTLN